MLVRREEVRDVDAVHSVVAAAFESEVEPELVRRIRASTLYIPELSLVAVDGEAVVGHVMISGATLHTSFGATPIPLLAPLAVAPQRQGQGVGAALTRTVCDAADRRGMPLVVLEGSPAYYGRFGFEPSFEHGIELPLPGGVPREAGQILRLGAYDPGLTGAVAYPAAFDDLEDV